MIGVRAFRVALRREITEMRTKARAKLTKSRTSWRKVRCTHHGGTNSFIRIGANTPVAALEYLFPPPVVVRSISSGTEVTP